MSDRNRKRSTNTAIFRIMAACGWPLADRKMAFVN
jgi:hypothetical protein